MRIYLAGLTLRALLAYHNHNKFPNEKPNVLLSYSRMDGQTNPLLETHRQKLGGMILDSGAYTIWKSKNSQVKDPALTLEGYCAYARATRLLFDFIFNFDTDFSEDGFAHNLANQVSLEKAGLKPVPVVHDIYGDEINFYVKKKYPIIALGSVQINGEPDLRFACNRLKGANAKIHLFGNTGFDFLGSYPIWSCDSSTWHQEAGRGYIQHLKIDNYRLRTFHVQFDPLVETQDANRFPYTRYPYVDQLENMLLKTFKFTFSDLMGPTGIVYRQIVNIRYYMELQKRLSDEQDSKGVLPKADQ
jgi:hypothetical protein